MKHVGRGLGGRRINLHAAMEQESDRNVLSVRRPVMQKSRGNHRDVGRWNNPSSFHWKLFSILKFKLKIQPMSILFVIQILKYIILDILFFCSLQWM